MTTEPGLLITCEHGGNRIPRKYLHLFKRQRRLLESHRGYDPGALALARDFAAALHVELVYSTTSRLLVELNRSPHHPKLFSEVTRALSREERQQVLDRHYFPYREWVESQIGEAAGRGKWIVHLSCHSFTPRLNGIERRADVGLLYDPGRRPERELCIAWQRELKRADSRLVVRRNYPYRGYDDGLTTYLRLRYPAHEYSGIELEVNQTYALGEPHDWRAMRKRLVTTFMSAMRHSLSRFTSPARSRS